MASAFCMAGAPESVYSEREGFRTSAKAPYPVLQWNSNSFQLYELYDLAQSLHYDGTEVTPVQAWFELARRYPAELLLREDLQSRLQVELMGVVRCVHYGAVIETGAFESIISRVLGPPSQ